MTLGVGLLLAVLDGVGRGVLDGQAAGAALALGPGVCRGTYTGVSVFSVLLRPGMPYEPYPVHCTRLSPARTTHATPS